MNQTIVRQEALGFRGWPLLLALVLAGCDPADMMPGDQSAFVDQGFKSTIAAVEVYNLRHGSYPESLDDLTYTGAWFPLFRQFVRYRRVGEGYVLRVDADAADQLAYPERFFSGLGLVKTNVGRETESL